MEQEAKRMLMERLDDCLKVHADLLDAQDIGSIYELQDLAQLHYYLKVEHPFTPVSYTHLDVYKRQVWTCVPMPDRGLILSLLSMRGLLSSRWKSVVSRQISAT